jgi:hypothetical protein
LGDNTDLLPLAEVMGAGGKQLEAEGLKADDWQFHKRVEYPCAPPLAARFFRCAAAMRGVC